jgi:hypothetical protein
LTQQLVIKEVFLVKEVNERYFTSAVKGGDVKILIDSAIFLHKNTLVNVNEAIQIALKLKKSFKILVSGAKFGDLDGDYQIIALVIELETPLDISKPNDISFETTEIRHDLLEETDENEK